jgi:hypothetical protein
MDSLDPKLYPQFRPRFGRYHTYALDAMLALRHAAGFEASWHVIPNASNTAVIALGRFEQRISVPPQSYIWGFAAYSQQGFQVQIYDLGTSEPWFSQPLNYQNLSGQGSTPEGITSPLYLLPAPRLVLEPGLLSVQITNLSSQVNTIKLLMLMVTPAPGTQPKNVWNAILDAEASAARRAVRNAGLYAPIGTSAGPGGTTAPAVSSADTSTAELEQAFEAALAGDNVILPGFGSMRIKIVELSLYNSTANDIEIWDGAAKKLHGTLTGFPAGAGFFLPGGSRPHFELTPGNSFVIKLANATQVSGFVRYRME